MRSTPATTKMVMMTKCRSKFLTLIIVVIIFQSVTFITFVHKKIIHLNNENNNSNNALLRPRRRQLAVIPEQKIGSGSSISMSTITSNRINNNNNNNNKDTTKNDAVMIIAAIPLSERHIVALWSELECFVTTTEDSNSVTTTGDGKTTNVNHVVISSTYWAKPIIEHVLKEVRLRIPLFVSKQVTIEAQYYVNNRYDVGLWCDALSYMDGELISSSSSSLNNDDDDEIEGLSSYDEIGLINDSVFALREYTSILDSIHERNVSMTSLSYSLIHPNGYGPEHYWLESVWRGFSKEGIKTFIDYSCRPKATDPLYCPTQMWGRKGCIVENFERQMSRQFPKEKTYGIFPSDVPKNMLSWTNTFHSWVRHPPYWNKLVKEQNFPVSKVNWKGMIDSINDSRLKTCTKFLVGNNNNNGSGGDDDERLSSWLNGFDFSLAKDAI